MPQFVFVGDPRNDFSATPFVEFRVPVTPGSATVKAYAFRHNGEPVEVDNPQFAERLRNNDHFVEVPDGDNHQGSVEGESIAPARRGRPRRDVNS